jgi:hypothetical protein
VQTQNFSGRTAGLTSFSDVFHSFLVPDLLHFRWRATKPGDIFERRMEAFKKFRVSDMEIAQFIAPFSYSIRKPAFQLICLIISGYNIFLFGNLIRALEDYGVKRLTSLRYVPSGPSTLDSVAVTELTLLFNGCESVISGIGNNFSKPVIFKDVVTMNGFKIKFQSPAQASTTMAFALFGSMDNWTSSFIVGSSDMRWGETGVRFLQHPVPVQDQLNMDYRPNWEWYVVLFLRLVGAIAILIASICGHLNLPSTSKTILVHLTSGLALSDAIVFAGYLAASFRREAFTALVDGLLFLFLSAVLASHEAHFPHACLAFGLAALAADAVSDCALFQNCAHLAENPPTAAIGLAVWGAACAIFRRRLTRRRLRAVAAQRARYDSEWLLRSRDHAGVEELEALAGRLAAAAGCSPRPVQQRTRGCRLSGLRRDASSMLVESMIAGSDANDSDEGASPASLPLRSLDQLYAQVRAYAMIKHAKKERENRGLHAPRS